MYNAVIFRELRPQGGDLLQIKGPRVRSELSSALHFRNIPPPYVGLTDHNRAQPKHYHKPNHRWSSQGHRNNLRYLPCTYLGQASCKCKMLLFWGDIINVYKALPFKCTGYNFSMLFIMYVLYWKFPLVLINSWKIGVCFNHNIQGDNVVKMPTLFPLGVGECKGRTERLVSWVFFWWKFLANLSLRWTSDLATCSLN